MMAWECHWSKLAREWGDFLNRLGLRTLVCLERIVTNHKFIIIGKKIKMNNMFSNHLKFIRNTISGLDKILVNVTIYPTSQTRVPF